MAQPAEGQDEHEDSEHVHSTRVGSPQEGVVCRWEHGRRLRHRDLVKEKAVQGRNNSDTRAEMFREGGRGHHQAVLREKSCN